jgi:hypothetical protein
VGVAGAPASQASSAVTGFAQVPESGALSEKQYSASSIVRLSSLREKVAGALTIVLANSGARIGSTSSKLVHAVALVVPTFQPACSPRSPGFSIIARWMACTAACDSQGMPQAASAMYCLSVRWATSASASTARSSLLIAGG